MEVEAEELWNREIVAKVMKIVSTRLPQRDLINLLLVSPSIHRNLVSHPSLWLVLDFHEMSNAGDRLIAALSLPRYQNVKHIILEFARDIEDRHLEIVKNKCGNSVKNMEILNLNSCQKISDAGIEFITCNCPKLKVFSIYWNVRVSDPGIRNLVNNCKHLIDLNLSGCKNVTDESLKLIAQNYQGLQFLNLTSPSVFLSEHIKELSRLASSTAYSEIVKCVKLTDKGLEMILVNCSSLQSLNLYALSSFTDAAYKRISLLTHLQFLDLCGAQNLSDDGLSCIAKCKNLTSLNLTWCVRVTDEGVIALAESCRYLEFLSLFGIVGVTDKSLDALSRTCSGTITTLDVNGCIGVKRRSRGELLQLFPKLKCFKVHS